MDGDIEDDIWAALRAGWSPTQVFNYIDKKLDKEGRHSPDIRTIRRMATEIAPIKTSDRWSMVDCDPEDARLVLDFLAGCMAEHTTFIGYNNYLSKEEAKWVIKLSKAAPGASPRIISALVTLYTARVANEIADTTDLDAYLAFKPWEKTEYLALYKRTVARKMVPMVPMWAILVVEISPKKLVDPRFSDNKAALLEFEEDICKRKQSGESPDAIADIYEIHRDDVDEIIRNCERRHQNDR
jgi:hypothetical protein